MKECRDEPPSPVGSDPQIAPPTCADVRQAGRRGRRPLRRLFLPQRGRMSLATGEGEGFPVPRRGDSRIARRPAPVSGRRTSNARPYGANPRFPVGSDPQIAPPTCARVRQAGDRRSPLRGRGRGIATHGFVDSLRGRDCSRPLVSVCFSFLPMLFALRSAACAAGLAPIDDHAAQRRAGEEQQPCPQRGIGGIASLGAAALTAAAATAAGLAGLDGEAGGGLAVVKGDGDDMAAGVQLAEAGGLQGDDRAAGLHGVVRVLDQGLCRRRRPRCTWAPGSTWRRGSCPS